MTTLTPEELAVIYHEANGLTTNQLAPITTARVFNAMLAVDAHARQQSAKEIADLKAQVERLRKALTSAVETIEWMHSCTSPADDEVEQAIQDGRTAIIQEAKK